MRRWMRALLVAIAASLSVTDTAGAADTGTISGVVLDTDGAPVADASVRISGERLPSGRVVATDTNGLYRLEYVPPGDYTLDVRSAAGDTATRSLVVGVGRDTQVDVLLGLSVSEALTVTAFTPRVDTRSTEVSFNVQADTLSRLPLERTYRGLFQLIPGVAENRSLVGPAAGGSRQDNTYLMDGANIGNPTFGYLGADVSELDVAEVNLKRAGITAEFGRTSGTVTNAVSRSGTNRLSGIGRVTWMPTALIANYALPTELLQAGIRPGTFRDPILTTDMTPAVGVGGPILKDHVFFYGSARYFSERKWERLNKIGQRLPDERRTGQEVFGKLTASWRMRHQFTAGYRHRPYRIANAAINSDFAPEVALDSDNLSRIATTEWAYFMTPLRAINVRYLHTNEDNHDVPVTALGFLPAFDPARLTAMGQYTDPAQANLIVGAGQYSSIQNYRRREVRGTVTQFLDVGPTSHALKAGIAHEVSEEHLNRTANGWGTIVNITQGGIASLRARYFAPQPPQLGDARTSSLFVQDEITTARRLSANVGVLLNRDVFAQTVAGSGGCPTTVFPKGGAAVYESRGDACRFLRFGFADEIQPRLGLSYQVRRDKGDKVYANWGRYYNMDQKSSGRSLAPNRIFQTQTIFDLQGRVLSSGPLASTTGKAIDPDIRPSYTNEFLVGYATPFANAFSLDVFVMSRDMKNIIEDVPSRLSGSAPDSGPFVAVNLPCERLAACRSADARRTYRAVTIDVRRQLAQGWMSDVSYTWSRFEGNFDIDYALTSVFNTSSFVQDGPGTNVEEPNRRGPLFEDRPHVFKAFTAHTVASRLTASAYLRVQSGTPWAARGRDWAGSTLNYLEPAGSHRNPTWVNMDVMTAYRLPLASRVGVSIEVRLLNAFNSQTRLSTDAQQYLDLRTLPVPPYFAPYTQPNPFFGAGNSFAPPRRLYLATVVTY